MRLVPWIGLLLVAIDAAQACTLPPFNERTELQGAVSWVDTDEGCALDARIDAKVRGAAAMAHFRQREATQDLEIRFRVDLQSFGTQGFLERADLLHAVAADPVGLGEQRSATVLALAVSGTLAGASRNLILSGACPGQPTGQCATVLATSASRPELILRLDQGAGTGVLRLWLDRPTSEPPSASLSGLDTLALGGIERLALGLGSPSDSFRAAQLGRSLRFDRIALGDDQISWITHESGEASDCPAGPSLALGPGGISGSTCDASFVIPALASGSSRMASRTAIFSFDRPEDMPAAQRVFTLTETAGSFGAAMFLCPRPCGPATRCVAVGDAGSPINVSNLSGSWALMVKSMSSPQACGAYTLQVSGTLD